MKNLTLLFRNISGLCLNIGLQLTLSVFSLLAWQSAYAQSNDYVLGAGDLVFITVHVDPDMSIEEIKVGESGNITFDYLGSVKVSGLTVDELEASLRTRLIDAQVLINPEITVGILEYRPFYIRGEVEDPGSYPFEPGLTLGGAIAIAGDFTERAHRSKITVVNNSPDSGAPPPDEREINVDMRIYPGDTITVATSFF